VTAPALPPDAVDAVDRYAAVPAELRERPQWVVWRVESRDGKPTKVPYQARRPSAKAAANAPDTWGAFSEAVLAARRDRSIAGVGFVFTQGGGYVGVDLDKCRHAQTGALEPWAADVVAALDSYTEVSPSGTGVHVLVRGSLPAGGNRKGRVEMYGEGRYFTVTGAPLDGAPLGIAERTPQLAAVHAQHIGTPALFTGAEPADAQPTDPAAPQRAAGPVAPLPPSDADLVDRALRAKNGDKLRTLYQWGDAAGYDGDQSSADLALVSILAFWTQDPAQLDRLFRSSALMRAKWDERRGTHTYGERTIATALASVTSTASAPALARSAAPVSVTSASASASPEPSEPEGFPDPVRLLDAPPPEPVTWLIDDLWTAGDIGLLVAPDGVMKTTLALHIACAVAGGRPAFGRFPTRHRPVLFISEEDPQSVLVNRAEAMVRGQGWDRTAVLGNLHVLAMTGIDLIDPAWAAHVLAAITRLDVGLVILDPLAEIASGDENSNSERRPLMKACRRFTQPTGAAVMLVHHFGKAGGGADGERPKRERIRGATGVSSASRCTYTLEPRDGEVQIECLKLSRGAKPAPFIVRPTITSRPESRLVWESARFDHVDLRTAALDRAEAYLVEHLAGGVALTSTDLRTAAKGSGISNEEIARALVHLETRRLVTFTEGPRGAKLWRLTVATGGPNGPAGPAVRGPSRDPADPAGTLPRQGHLVARAHPAYGPKGLGQGGQARANGQPPVADDDAAYQAAERAALEGGA
jgi:putative DNA primase/helicase